MTLKLNDNPTDPMFQVHVNLWHSVLQDVIRKDGKDLAQAIADADEAVKQFKRRFKVPVTPLTNSQQQVTESGQFVENVSTETTPAYDDAASRLS